MIAQYFDKINHFLIDTIMYLTFFFRYTNILCLFCKKSSFFTQNAKNELLIQSKNVYFRSRAALIVLIVSNAAAFPLLSCFLPAAG